jgi:hypothetical protein
LWTVEIKTSRFEGTLEDASAKPCFAMAVRVKEPEDEARHGPPG